MSLNWRILFDHKIALVIGLGLQGSSHFKFTTVITQMLVLFELAVEFLRIHVSFNAIDNVYDVTHFVLELLAFLKTCLGNKVCLLISYFFEVTNFFNWCWFWWRNRWIVILFWGFWFLTSLIGCASSGLYQLFWLFYGFILIFWFRSPILYLNSWSCIKITWNCLGSDLVIIFDWSQIANRIQCICISCFIIKELWMFLASRGRISTLIGWPIDIFNLHILFA